MEIDTQSLTGKKRVIDIEMMMMMMMMMMMIIGILRQLLCT